VSQSASDDVARLTAQLHEATLAASNAYRDAGRLIRLLTVLSSPSTPDELVGHALAVLSEVFTADVVCVVSTVGERFLVTSASGLPEDDPSFMDGWDLGTAAKEAVSTGQPVAGALERRGHRHPAVAGRIEPAVRCLHPDVVAARPVRRDARAVSK
jgi:hypothetical protein